MKKRMILLTLFAVASLLLSGCAQTYVGANSEIDLFSCFDAYGGEVTRVDISPDASAEVHVKFASASYAKRAEKGVNVDGGDMSETRFDSGERVIALKSEKDREAVYYIKNINFLKSDSAMFLTVSEYIERFGADSEDWIGKGKEKIELSNVDGKKSVVIFRGIPQIEISVGGRVIAASKDGNVRFDGNVLSYAGSECAIVFERSYMVLIICVTVGVLILLGVVFLLLVKFQVFTDIKLKKAKN